MPFKTLFAAASLLALGAASGAVAGHHEKKEAAAAGETASATIVETALASKDHETLVAALKAAALVETLSGEGPFTVFAPTDAAFGALPAGTLDTLLKPENKDQLAKILTAHVVAGELNAADLAAKAEKNSGKASLTTVSGDTLTFWMKEGEAYVGDESGGAALVTSADLAQSNGVIHIVDKVLLPQ